MKSNQQLIAEMLTQEMEIIAADQTLLKLARDNPDERDGIIEKMVMTDAQFKERMKGYAVLIQLISGALEVKYDKPKLIISR